MFGATQVSEAEAEQETLQFKTQDIRLDRILEGRASSISTRQNTPGHKQTKRRKPRRAFS